MRRMEGKRLFLFCAVVQSALQAVDRLFDLFHAVNRERAAAHEDQGARKHLAGIPEKPLFEDISARAREMAKGEA